MSTTDGEGRKRLVGVHLPPALIEALRERAAAAGLSVERYCEAALEAAVRELFDGEG